jgi:hypothetical protein
MGCTVLCSAGCGGRDRGSCRDRPQHTCSQEGHAVSYKMLHCAVLCYALQVMEDVTEGPVVTGLSTHVAKNAEELRGWYNSGRANRDTQVRRSSYRLIS